MLKAYIGFGIIAFVGALAGTSSIVGVQSPRPGMMDQGMMGYGMMMGSMARHHQYTTGGIPPAYRSAKNPLPYDEQSMRRGAAVYAHNCATCHGAAGAGDGPAGKALNAPPANLAWGSGIRMMREDPYLYWTVEEGGAPVGSAMPAFKRVLSEKDVWAVVTYVQHGVGSTAYRDHCCGRHSAHTRH
jgi:mono/diheme cytochrome c family protein